MIEQEDVGIRSWKEEMAYGVCACDMGHITAL